MPFEADILAAEDFDRIYRSRPLSPERELMVAVLEEALADYQHCWKTRDKKGMDRFADAQRGFWSRTRNGFSLSSIVVKRSVLNPTTCAKDYSTTGNAETVKYCGDAAAELST